MRSNTITPLLQLIEWFGIDPWKANGINKDTHPKANPKCHCLFQHAWTKNTQWSRDDLISILETAEQVFVWETMAYPGTKEIQEENIKYYGKKFKNNLINQEYNWKSVRPKFASKLQEFGTYNLQFVDTVSLDTSDLDNFILTTTVPAGTNPEDVVIFFTSADANYLGDPDYGDHTWEIRPLRNKYIVGTNLTINIPTYLLRKPDLDEHTSCLTHELETYVDELSVYVKVKNLCDDGYFVSEGDEICSGEDCEETLSPLCVSKRLVGDEYWAVPKPFRCDEDEILRPYCLQIVPTSVRINYQTGFEFLESGDTQRFINEIIMKLAVGLADCVKDWCPCEGCAEDKLSYYRQVERVKIEDADPTIKAVGDRYQPLLHPSTMQLLAGYPLYRGLTMAYRDILKLGLNTVEGSFDFGN